MKVKYKIFTDFDGTIALNDVGDTLFATFAGKDWQQAIQDWKDGIISSREYYIRICRMTKVTRAELESFSDSQQLDPHFREFVDFCLEYDYPLTVLSDGMDFYIRRILEKNGLGFLPVHSNQLFFEGKTGIRPEFPYYGKGCPSCGNCKGYHVSRSRENGECIIFIGDGLSDRCGVREADIIFAKDELSMYCVEQGISFHPFANFKDILLKIKELSLQHGGHL